MVKWYRPTIAVWSGVPKAISGRLTATERLPPRTSRTSAVRFYRDDRHLRRLSGDNRRADYIEIPGYPEKISMWVYGDGNTHWLRAQLRDSKGTIGLDFTDQTTGVDFKGWKYLEASVPKGRTLPLVMDAPVRYMETNNAKRRRSHLRGRNSRIVRSGQ